MPFLMIRNDITKVAADAIVNPANRNLLQGSGTSRAIYQAAGEQKLTAACEAIGYCELGRAVCTPAFRLPAKYIFHAVCPAWPFRCCPAETTATPRNRLSVLRWIPSRSTLWNTT